MFHGQQIDRYVIKDKIDEGGMGAVYRAYDPKRGHDVAIKSIRPDLLDRPNLVHRFRREVKIALSIVHPFIATVLDSLQVDGKELLVMEFVKGETLQQALDRGELDFEQSVRIASELTEGISAIHEKGLVHRDIKPANVILAETGHVKLLDLGLARPVAQYQQMIESSIETMPIEALPLTRGPVGTLAYMSPEQLRGLAVDGRTDLFALGIILWQIATRQHPFRRATAAETKSAILEESPADSRDQADLGRFEELIPVATRALQKQPEQRYDTAEEIRKELHAVLEIRPAPARSRRVWAAGLIVVAAFALALWGIIPPSDAVSVLVVPRVVVTDSSDTVSASRALGARIAARLANWPGIEPLDPQRGIEIALAMEGSSEENLKSAAAPLSPDWIVTTSVVEDGDGVSAILRIIDGKGTRVDKSVSVRSASIGSLIPELLRRFVGVIAPKFADAAPDVDLEGDRDIPDEILLKTDIAERRLREARLSDAIELLEAILEEVPDFVRARQLYGNTLYATGRTTRAADELKRARREMNMRGANEDSLPLLRLQADLSRAEASKKEIELRKTVVEKSNQDPTALLRLAFSLHRHGRSAEALPIFSDLAERNEFAVGASRGAYTALLRMGRLDESTDHVDTLEAYYRELDIPAGHAQVQEARGRIARERRQYAGARRHFEQAAQYYKTAGLPVKALFCRRHIVDTYLQEGDTAKASHLLSVLKEALMSSQNLAVLVRVHGRLGAILYQAQRFDEAEPELRRAVELSREVQNDVLRTTPLLNLGSVLGYLGRRDEAEVLIRSGLPGITKAGTPGEAVTARVLLAEMTFQKGDPEESRATYTDAIEFAESRGNPGGKLSWAWVGRSEVEEALGLLGPALRSAETAVTITIDSGNKVEIGHALLRLARVQIELGDNSGARATVSRLVDELGESLTTMPDHLARIDLLRGLIELNSGADFEQGRPFLERAAEAGEDAKAQRLATPAFAALARWSALAGKNDLARGWAARAMQVPYANEIDHLEARIMAVAVAPAGEDTDEEALSTCDDVHRSQARLLLIDAAAVLARRNGDHEDSRVEQTLELARRAAAEVLESIEESGRAAFLARPKIRDSFEEIGFDAEATAQGMPRRAHGKELVHKRSFGHRRRVAGCCRGAAVQAT